MSDLSLRLGDKVEAPGAGRMFTGKAGTVVSIFRRGTRNWIRVAFDGLSGNWAFEPHELRFVERPA